MTTIGIPRGLFYYYQYPLWKTFFTDLGAAVVTSGATTRTILDNGLEYAVDECCLPIKVYCGHIAELISRQPDYIFVPRLVSIESGSYICPKFMGLPDMIRALITKCPPLIDITVDFSRSDRQMQKDILRLGSMFTGNCSLVWQAYEHGCQQMKALRVLTRQGCTPAEAISIWEGQPRDQSDPQWDLQVGVLGHGYSLNDPVISLELIQRLRNLGCRVALNENCDPGSVEQMAASLPKKVFWTLGRKMMGSAMLMDRSKDIDGIVYLACFGCGPDSLVGEMITRRIQYKPFLFLTLDEHSGEGGLATRLEAFCDMLRRRREKGDRHLSTYGNAAYPY